jgi:hypothetical protein
MDVNQKKGQTSHDYTGKFSQTIDNRQMQGSNRFHHQNDGDTIDNCFVDDWISRYGGLLTYTWFIGDNNE